MEQADIGFFDLEDSRYQHNPRPHFQALSGCPFAKSKRGYVVLDRAMARKALQEDVPISTDHISAEKYPYLADRTKEPLLKRFGPEHKRLRGILSLALRTRIIDGLRSRIVKIFEELLDAVMAKGDADLVSDLCDPFVARVISPILGIPDEDIPMVAKWVGITSEWVNTQATNEDLSRIEYAWQELENYLLKILKEKRTNSSGDIFSELLEKMSEFGDLEIVGVAAEMTRAGYNTTRRQLACTLYALITNPSQWRKLVENPSLAASAVEEGLRFSPIIHLLNRQILADKTIDGLAVKAGELLSVPPYSVNFDQSIPEADQFDITRAPNQHFTLGFGSHLCLGAPLARMEMVEALTAMARRIESMELKSEITRSSASVGWVPLSLPVKIHPRQ